MKVKELKGIIDMVDPELEVGIAVETPGGYVCPDGCLVGVRYATRGMDWHMGDFVIVPKYQLRMTEKGEDEWKGRKLITNVEDLKESK